MPVSGYRFLSECEVIEFQAYSWHHYNGLSAQSVKENLYHAGNSYIQGQEKQVRYDNGLCKRFAAADKADERQGRAYCGLAGCLDDGGLYAFL